MESQVEDGALEKGRYCKGGQVDSRLAEECCVRAGLKNVLQAGLKVELEVELEAGLEAVSKTGLVVELDAELELALAAV